MSEHLWTCKKFSVINEEMRKYFAFKKYIDVCST